MEAWALARGEYSDYRIFATFDRKEDAEAAADAFNSGDEYGECYVESSFHYTPPDLPQKVTYWRMSRDVWDDGTCSPMQANQYTEWEYDTLWGPVPATPSKRWVRAPMYRDKGGRAEVMGFGRDECEKVLDDLVTEVLGRVAMVGKAGRIKGGGA